MLDLVVLAAVVLIRLCDIMELLLADGALDELTPAEVYKLQSYVECDEDDGSEGDHMGKVLGARLSGILCGEVTGMRIVLEKRPALILVVCVVHCWLMLGSMAHQLERCRVNGTMAGQRGDAEGELMRRVLVRKTHYASMSMRSSKCRLACPARFLRC